MDNGTPTQGSKGELGIYKVAKGALRVYECLAAYAQSKGLDAHALAMDYKRLADLAGYADKSNARTAALHAEKDGILARLDSGTLHVSGQAGRSTMFCLRGDGETMADAIAAGKRTKQYQARVDSQPPETEPKPKLLGALKWDQLREADRDVYGDVCVLLRHSSYSACLPEIERHPNLRAGDARDAIRAAERILSAPQTQPLNRKLTPDVGPTGLLQCARDTGLANPDEPIFHSTLFAENHRPRQPEIEQGSFGDLCFVQKLSASRTILADKQTVPSLRVQQQQEGR